MRQRLSLRDKTKAVRRGSCNLLRGSPRLGVCGSKGKITRRSLFGVWCYFDGFSEEGRFVDGHVLNMEMFDFVCFETIFSKAGDSSTCSCREVSHLCEGQCTPILQCQVQRPMQDKPMQNNVNTYTLPVRRYLDVSQRAQAEKYQIPSYLDTQKYSRLLVANPISR